MPGEDLTPHLDAAIDRALQELLEAAGGAGLLDSMPDDRRAHQELVWRLATTRSVLADLRRGRPLEEPLQPFREQLDARLEERVAELQAEFDHLREGFRP